MALPISRDGLSTKTAERPERRPALDWLRVLATAAVFLFHCGRLFDFDDWHVKNTQLNLGVSIWVGFLSQWLMPILFVLSGTSIALALRARSPRHFVHDRFKRLVVPLIFGILVVVPPQVYLERLSRSQFAGPFWAFYPHYFDGWYTGIGERGNFAWMGLHLWYLLLLFIYSSLALPIFLVLQRAAERGFFARLTAAFDGPGMIFLPALPIAALEIALDPETLGFRDLGGWSVFVYLLFLIYGYLIFGLLHVDRVMCRYAMIALVGSLLTSLCMLALGLTSDDAIFGSVEFNLRTLLRAFNCWFWIVALFGLGHRYLNFSNALLRYASEAVLPFYVLHQTVIVIVGFSIVQWDTPVPAKYCAVIFTSAVLIVGLHMLVIRRIAVLRFVFGLKPTA